MKPFPSNNRKWSKKSLSILLHGRWKGVGCSGWVIRQTCVSAHWRDTSVIFSFSTAFQSWRQLKAPRWFFIWFQSLLLIFGLVSEQLQFYTRIENFGSLSFGKLLLVRVSKFRNYLWLLYYYSNTQTKFSSQRRLSSGKKREKLTLTL